MLDHAPLHKFNLCMIFAFCVIFQFFGFLHSFLTLNLSFLSWTEDVSGPTNDTGSEGTIGWKLLVVIAAGAVLAIILLAIVAYLVIA